LRNVRETIAEKNDETSSEKMSVFKVVHCQSQIHGIRFQRKLQEKVTSMTERFVTNN